MQEEPTIEKQPPALVSAPVPAPAPEPRATSASHTVEGRPLEVVVDDRGLERAIRRLKRKIDTEGITREVKRRRHYEKPSVRKRRKAREAERRRRRRDRRLLRKPGPT
ncbi:MAG: 30S ribosomal protein S21 [Proteobacteria bacterium]|nr:30S ribosomal protein S21 [Pseudomonadota bacterium]